MVLGTRLTDHISNSKLHVKCDYIPLSTAIIRETLRCLRHVLRMKDSRLPKIGLVGQPSRSKWKAGRPRMRWEDVVRKYLREIGTSCEGVKREAFIDWNGGGVCVLVYAHSSLWPQAVWCCSKLLVVVMVKQISRIWNLKSELLMPFLRVKSDRRI